MLKNYPKVGCENIITAVNVLRLFGVFFIFLITSEIYSQTSWKASSEVIEKLSVKRTDINYYEEKVPTYILPELLISLNGKEINNRSEWEKYRRPEILELFTIHVYGRVPRTLYSLDFRVISEDPLSLGGMATARQVDITVRVKDKSLTIHLFLFVPNKIKKPAPLFLLVSNLPFEKIKPSRNIMIEFWPVEEAISRGYGMAVFNIDDVDPDNYDGFGNGIHALLDSELRKDDSWGTIAAWAWGASRCLDYLITDKTIDKNKIAIIGHSQGGKAALWAGATDQRFSMVIANESGCGGSALARRRYGETIALINDKFPHWFCMNFRKFNNNENSMPVDMHMLLALIAPRALYISAADEDLSGDPRGSYLSLYYSLPVYRLYNKKITLEKYMPPLNIQIISGNVGFHIRNGEHDLKFSDWNLFMDFADKIWK